MNELQECHRLVWAFRKEIETYWTTPDPLNSLRYAFCECAEAMDAWLRAERPSDSRNNDRDNDVLDELADCAIMLFTAMGQDLIPTREFDKELRGRFDSFGYHISVLLNKWPDAPTTDYIFIINLIANYPGMELKQRIQGRLARIAFKHMPLFKSAELIEKLQLPATNLPYNSVNHPLVNE